MADVSNDIAALIRSRAAAHGVDPETLLRIAQIESSLNPNASNPRSSAGGLFQAINSTWNQYGGGNKFDPYQSADFGARFLRDNTKALGTTEGGPAYLGHFLGVGGAKKLMGADPGASALSILGPDVIRANPHLSGMTAADVRAWADRKMGLASTAAAGVRQTAGGVPPVPRVPLDSGTAPMGLAPELPAGDLAGLQHIAALAAQEDERPRIRPMTINYPTPPGLAKARALARAMSAIG